MRALGAWLLALLLSGCVAPTPAVGPGPADEVSSAARRGPVIALLDSGLDPYHEVFLGTAYAGSNAQRVALSATGAWEERYAADRATWDGIKRGVLYAFEGTRTLGISFREENGEPRIIDAASHGTGTASIVAVNAPTATLVVVQVDGDFCTAKSNCTFLPKISEAMQWVAEQDWIDVVSISMNTPANVPAQDIDSEEAQAFLVATRNAHDSGKPVVFSSGNDAAPAILSHMGGPPWMIAVGGHDPMTYGDNPASGRGVDVAANYTVRVAQSGTADGWRDTAGTSFAAPLVAAELGEYLAASTTHDFIARRLEARDALNASASAPTAAWRPADAIANATNTSARAGVPYLVPGAQAGWGLVDGSTSIMMIRGEAAPRTPAHASYMREWQALRERAWS